MKSIIVVNNNSDQKVMTKITNTLKKYNYQFETSSGYQNLLEQTRTNFPQIVIVSNHNNESDIIRKYKRSNPHTELILIYNTNKTHFTITYTR